MSRTQSVSEIQRISCPTYDEFKSQYVETGRPVVLTNIVNDWPATTLWKNTDYLIETCGSRPADVLVEDDFALVTDDNQTRRNMSLRDYLHALEAKDDAEPLYLADVPLSRFPELIPDVGQVPFFTNTEKELSSSSRVLFLGGKTFTPAHHHANCMSMVAMVFGAKRMRLFAPDQSRYLYPPTLWQWLRTGANPMSTQVDIDSPDLGRFPRFENAEPLEVTLLAGEMLFIPVHWWHAVYTDEYSCAVTYNFPVPPSLWHFPNPGLLTLGVQAREKLTSLRESLSSQTRN